MLRRSLVGRLELFSSSYLEVWLCAKVVVLLEQDLLVFLHPEVSDVSSLSESLVSGLDAKIGDGKIDGVLGGSPDAEMLTVAMEGPGVRKDLWYCMLRMLWIGKSPITCFFLIRMDAIF